MFRPFSLRHRKKILNKEIQITLLRRLRKRLWAVLESYDCPYRYQTVTGFNINSSLLEQVEKDLKKYYGVEELTALNKSNEEVVVDDLKDFFIGAYPAQVLDVIEIMYQWLMDEGPFDVLEKYSSEINATLKEEESPWKLSNGRFFKNQEGDLVEIESIPFFDSGKIDEKYIREQIYKCEKKLSTEDYDGAITNARSLLETVLTGIEKRLVEDPPEYDGKLSRLFTRVRKQLNLDPSREDLNDRLKEILSGLISIVSGMAGLRNRMSDAHVRKYRPDQHHAKLAVNAVNTICDFLIATYEYQRKKGLIEDENKN